MTTLVYDAGALSAAEANDQRMWRMHEEALVRGDPVVVAAPVLAQAWRGGPQPLLSRLLHGCLVEAMDEAVARAAGRTCGKAGSSDVVDATVAVLAVRHSAEVVTSDRKDIESLSHAIGLRIVLRVV